MALTKVTLTGAVETIKAGWTKFNGLIDDLLSTSNGKGASQIGVEDSAGNMAAGNVETALAEIYTDTTTARAIADGLDENSATTTGLTWGYKAGTIRIGAVVTSVAASTIALTDDATNYVEVNTSAVMTKNTTSFTSGYIPVRQIICASGSQSTSTDKRSWFNTAAIASNAEGLLGQDTGKIVAANNIRNILYNLGPDSRAQFTHVNDTDITIEPASYRHNGTIDQIVYWASQLTYSFANLGTSDWSYLYLDDSAIVTADTNLLTASELTDSVTEPTWSAAKKGWYNGEDRCIFAVLTDGTDDILAFAHDSDYVAYDSLITDYNGGTPSDTYTDVTLTIPKFSTSAQVTFYSEYSNADTAFFWRTNGTNGVHVAGYAAAGITVGVNTAIVVTDSGQIIEVESNAASTNILTIHTDGWYLPIGL